MFEKSLKDNSLGVVNSLLNSYTNSSQKRTFKVLFIYKVFAFKKSLHITNFPKIISSFIIATPFKYKNQDFQSIPD